ncbi:MAG TPA: ATP-binding cassette domain-containing protein, partial [Nocardioidaceae bacterium]|nr:ATP-binding cassette domain-containing protein [Nocardioidaceae bacterium]
MKLTDLEISFSDEAGAHPVVHGIDLSIAPGERLAIVGESGSGKSTTAASVLGLLPGTGHLTGGSIEFRGEDITHAPERRMRALRGRQIGLVPQDPMSNLNPVARVGHQITETLITHRVVGRSAARDRAIELM